MLTLDEEVLDNLEHQHPGILKTIQHYENADLPACPQCRSKDTALVSCGIVGRSDQWCCREHKNEVASESPEAGPILL